MMATEDQRYNGWTNYPTWNVALWLSNEEGLYHQSIEIGAMEFEYEILRADAFKSWVRDELMPDLGGSMAADLLGYALDEVNWTEVADSFKPENQ